MQVHQNKQVKTFGKELIAAFLAQTKETIALGEIHNARFKIPALWDYGCCDRVQIGFLTQNDYHSLPLRFLRSPPNILEYHLVC
jgi:hypothetical protein